MRVNGRPHGIAEGITRALTLLTVLALPAVGCSQTPDKAPAPKASEKAPDKAAQKAPPMKASPFHDARANWLRGIAKAYSRAEDGIDVQPSDPDATNTSFDPHRTGSLMAWEASFDGKRIRGFAAPQGPIVRLADQDSLARLVDAAVEAGIDAPDLARRLVWMMGVGNQLVYEPEFAQMAPPPPEMPALKQIDGRYTLTFMVEEAGDTGVRLAYAYTLTVDGAKAELTRARQ